MQVHKRNGSVEAVDLNKIVNSIQRVCKDLGELDVFKIATKTVGGLVDNVTTREIDLLSIRNAVGLIIEDPIYSKVAARLMANYVQKENEGQDIHSFSLSIQEGYDAGLIGESTYKLVMANKRKLNAAIRHDRDWLFEYHGIQTVYDRYLLKHPSREVIIEGGKKQRLVIETPQYFFMRVACGLANTASEAVELYNLLSSLEYMTSSPTLFNSGTKHSQMSSCYLLDSPMDSLDDIYKRYSDIAQLSKFAGGIGVSASRIRSKGSHIHGTNGKSNGIVPWLHTMSGSVAAVNQCLHADTKLYTSTGLKRIADVVVGDMVLGHSGHYRRVNEVLQYGSSNERSVAIKVRHHNEPVRVTDGHPIYAITGVPVGTDHARIYKYISQGKFHPKWVEAGDLRKGDFVATPISSKVEDVVEFTADDAFFYGLMLGDGHIHQRSELGSSECGITFDSNTKTFGDWVKAYLDDKGINYWVPADRGTCSYIRWTYSEAMPFSYDDLYDENHEKRISLRFSHLPREKSTRIIEGLIETDGNISRGTEVTFTNSSAVLVDNLRYQLVRIGVASGIQSRRRADTRTITRSDGSTSVISYDNIYHDVRVPRFAELAKALGIDSVTKAHWLTHEDMIWSRIKDVQEIATPDSVYDLKVDVDETYTVSGALVHNGGKRKGAACVYLETHHPDILDFLELRDNTGEKERRAYNLNIANWISDLFMQRVKDDATWSLFDPAVAPELADLYGEDYNRRYVELEAAGKYVEQLPARKIYARMMRTLAETGNGWMCFKDTCNRRGNQVGEGGVIHLSNLCTEILEVTSTGTKIDLTREELMNTTATQMVQENLRVVGFDLEKDQFEVIKGMETAVCNLGSINIGRGYVKNGKLDKAKLHKNVATAIKYLDRVIDRNFYPIQEAGASNNRWRPVGLGLMGLADFFFQLGIPYDSDEAIRLSGEIQEEIYYQAVKTSCELAKEFGPHRDFHLTRAAKGELQFDLAGVQPSDTDRWDVLKADVAQYGLRNSLKIAIAPTATISHICGVEECIEPIKSNLLKRETLSGEFISINKYLVRDLQALGRWDAETINRLKVDEGSIARVPNLPGEMYDLYKTVWEMSQKKLIEHAVSRGAYIDQSQSLNLFIDLNKYPEDKRIAVLSSLYMYAWERGCKTTYYFRSRSASRIEKVTTTRTTQPQMAAENPEICESCT